MKHELIYNQGVGVVNEDAWLVHNNVFGVFDGATSMNRFIDRDGKTGGYLASHITKEVFLDKEISLKEGFRLANKKIEEFNILYHNRNTFWNTFWNSYSY